MEATTETHLICELVTRADSVGAALKARQLGMEAGLDAIEAGELALVVAELCGNAVRHAGGGSLEARIHATGWFVSVTDAGPGFPAWLLLGDAPPIELPAGTPRRKGLGAGVASARRLASRVQLVNQPGGGARIEAWKGEKRP